MRALSLSFGLALLVTAPAFGCAAVTTDAFDETVDGAVADANEDTSQPPADTSVPPADDGVPDSFLPPPDTGVVVPDTGVVMPDTRPDTLPDTRPDAPADTNDGSVVTSDVQCSGSPTSGTVCMSGQHCCITTSPTSGTRSYTCNALPFPGACTGVDLACDNTSDCAATPGSVCCGNLNNSGMGTATVSSSSCMAASQCTQMNNRIILCNPSQPNVCPAGRTCRQSMGTLPGYYLCL